MNDAQPIIGHSVQVLLTKAFQESILGGTQIIFEASF